MKELNQLLGLVGRKCENGIIYSVYAPTILDSISLKEIPEIWLSDVKEFMFGQRYFKGTAQVGPILENGEFGIYSGDLYRWVNKNMDKILRHYKIETITND